MNFSGQGGARGAQASPVVPHPSLVSKDGEMTPREVFALLHGVGLSVTGKSSVTCIYTDPSSESGFPDNSVGKESTCNAGDPGSIPGLGRSLREGKGYPLQYSGLENSMDCIVHGVTKSQTRLSDFHFTSLRWCIRNMWKGGGMRLTTKKNLSIGNT